MKDDPVLEAVLILIGIYLVLEWISLPHLGDHDDHEK
jgi:hypothetical protein